MNEHTKKIGGKMLADGTEAVATGPVGELDCRGEWRTASEAEATAFVRALDNPARRAVLRLLDQGPMWKSKLGQVVAEALGRRYAYSFIHYHLQPLERVGLVGVKADQKEVRAKVVYRRADYRVQFRPRPEPEQVERYTRKRIVGELRKALRKEGKR